MRCLLCRCTARQSRKPLGVSFVRTVDRRPIQQNSTTGKNSLYHAPARRHKQLRELYVAGRSFSTENLMDKMRMESNNIKIQTGLFSPTFLEPATAITAPETPEKSTCG